MVTFIRPPHVTELEGPHVSPTGAFNDAVPEDCVWVAGLMQFLGAHPGAAPATHREAERLRAEVQPDEPLGPSNTDQLLRAFKLRYAFKADRLNPGETSIGNKLVPGTIATVSGRLTNLPDGHRLRRFSPSFGGGHRWCVLNDGQAKVLVLDPLAPKNIGYTGDRATVDDVKKFASQGGVEHTLAPLATKEGIVQFVTAQGFEARPKRLLKIPRGTMLRRLDGSELLITDGELTLPVLGTANGRAGEFVVDVVTSVPYPDNVTRHTLVLAVLPNATPFDAPATTSTTSPGTFTQAQLDAAVLQARRAQFDADRAAAEADPVNIGPRP